ncbi:OB-fold domain-containing protein [Mycobacterium sp. E1747]|uniref:OB-fold domain-containing protein n=1 Tax=Mycobacterium sp. E1747 TaxID=1834128 RepID=UPI0008018388|nr:OB-fold domain-containing protein [Mycobacterium sp. E1747]OBH11022.1 hydroxymethylglutaryl-CoA synthase [Mycobacterium sp. E1747]
MKPLLAYAAYLPAHRVGKRVVAGFDEDSTTMAVAAAAAISSDESTALYFSTSTPAYSDKTNACAVHAALGLDSAVFATDLCGTGRSAFAAIRAAASGGGTAVAADVRIGRAGSADEKRGGDGAAALRFGDGEPIAQPLATATRTAEFLDRWRLPTRSFGQQWEERFGFERYATLIRDCAAEALQAAGLADVDHVALACPNSAVVKRAATLVKGQKSVVTPPIGFCGAADATLALCASLDTAEPGDTILLLSATDGCDALVLRVCPALAERRQPRPVAQQLSGGIAVDRLTYLSWRGLLELEPPRRPEPERAAAPPAGRNSSWKFGFVGTRCANCGFVHMPPARTCRSCGRIDAMVAAPAATLRGSVATFTVDHLAYSPSPPVVQVAVDVDGGGRCTLEVADAQPERLTVGARVGFTFRRLFTAGDVHDYFWKAALLDGQ